MKSILLGMIFCCVSVVCFASEPSGLKIYQVEDDFADVQDALKAGIEEQGLVVKEVSNVGEMLLRTGKDLGETQVLYAQAVNLEFCSAVYSRKMMAADPFNLVHCPFVISLFTLPKTPGMVHVMYQVPMARPGKEAAWVVEMAALLARIVEDVVD